MPIGHLLLNNNSLEKKLFTDNAEFSYFKSVYKKITEFSIEDINQYFVNEYGFSKRSSCILHNNADLINTIYFVATLPNIPYLNEFNEIGTAFRWIDNIGEKLIKSVEIEINNNIIQKITGYHINIYNLLLKKENGLKLNKMIGNIPELITFDNKKSEYKLYIPIPFWFCEEIGNSIPINKFDINKIKLNIELEEIENLLIYGPTHSIKIKESFVNLKSYEYIYQSKTKAVGQFYHFDKENNLLYYNLLSNNNFEILNDSIINNFIDLENSYFITNENKDLFYIPMEEQKLTNLQFNIDYITLNNAYFQIRYIFLDKEEQKIINNSPNLNYIIKQYKYITYNNIDSIKNNFNITGKNCVFDISWVCILENDIKNKLFFKYSNNINNSCLSINSFDIYSLRNNNYIRLLNNFYNYNQFDLKNINSYPFSINILKYQPSGTLNLSKIEKCNLFLEFDKTISIDNMINLFIIISSYNILSIKNNTIKLFF